MPRTFHADLFIKLDGNEVKVTESGEFTDNEWNVLKSFHDEAKQMFQSEAISSMKSNIDMSWDRERGITDNSNLPSDDDLYSLLHRLRPFVLQNEPIHFYKVINILRKHFIQKESQAGLVFMKDLFSSKIFRSQVEIRFNNDTIINSDETLDKWLNGFQYHRDNQKIAQIREINELLPNNTMKGIFVHMLIDKGKAIKNLAKTIEILSSSP